MKTSKNSINIITAFLISSTLIHIGCKDGKNNKSCSDYNRNSDEMISDWYYFKPGSFFIYALKSNQEEVDTLSVVSSNYYLFDDLYAVGCGEKHELRLKHSNSKFFPRWNDSSIATELAIEAFMGQYIEIYGGFMAERFLSPNAVKGSKSGTFDVADFYENFEINGNTFSNVFYLKRDFSQNQTSNVTELYWSYKYGIISNTLSSGLTWELVEYNIVL